MLENIWICQKFRQITLERQPFTLKLCSFVTVYRIKVGIKYSTSTLFLHKNASLKCYVKRQTLTQ